MHILIYTPHLCTELVYSLSKTPTCTPVSSDVTACGSQVSLSGSAWHLIIQEIASHLVICHCDVKGSNLICQVEARQSGCPIAACAKTLDTGRMG
jgi:hypothetical protein